MGDIVDDNFYKIFDQYEFDFDTLLNLREDVKNYIRENYVKRSDLPTTKKSFKGPNRVEIELDYDYDPEEGFSTKRIITDQFYTLYNPVTETGTVIVTIYDTDIEDLVKGTGIKLNGD